MVFASFIFLFWFLPVFLPLYFAAPVRWRNVTLILGSFVFYGWWRPQYVLLMIASVLIDYLVARRMGEPGDEHDDQEQSRRKRWLVLSVVANLGMLGWFKYANFFVDTWNGVAPWPIEWEVIVLPLGISFFTFQSMSYTIDVYRGNVKPTRSLLDLLCFVSMFPQLVAGPIVRYRDIQHSLVKRSTDLRMASDGVLRFTIGFSKKVLIADSVGPLVDAIFASESPGLVTAWMGVLGYSVQAYFDFSGYSDMAIGLGMLMGFRFPENFRSPMLSLSITELWRRWHISLGTWLRDYLYVSLGGGRRGEARAQFNVALTMLLGGLWHGASWTYVLWGAWNGLFLALERRFSRYSVFGGMPFLVKLAWTQFIWLIGLLFFRSESLPKLGQMTTGILGGNGIGTLPDMGQQQPFVVGGMVLGYFIMFFLPRSEVLVIRCQPLVMLSVLLAFVAAVCQLLTGDFVAFIYYQF